MRPWRLTWLPHKQLQSRKSAKTGRNPSCGRGCRSSKRQFWLRFLHIADIQNLPETFEANRSLLPPRSALGRCPVQRGASSVLCPRKSLGDITTPAEHYDRHNLSFLHAYLPQIVEAFGSLLPRFCYGSTPPVLQSSGLCRTPVVHMTTIKHLISSGKPVSIPKSTPSHMLSKGSPVASKANCFSGDQCRGRCWDNDICPDLCTFIRDIVGANAVP